VVSKGWPAGPGKLVPATGRPVLSSPLYSVFGHQVCRYDFALRLDWDTTYVSRLISVTRRG
jgi:hypothetical protein